MGVSAVINGKKYYAGNEKLMTQVGVDFKISIPCFEQAPKPLKKPRGIEITIAHGQETTSAESPQRVKNIQRILLQNLFHLLLVTMLMSLMLQMPKTMQVWVFRQL